MGFALSEDAKFLFDPPNDQNARGTGPTGASSSHPAARDPDFAVDEAESAMRKALGALGEKPRLRLNDDQPKRVLDRSGAGLHRRRFVQDGDVQVTVLRHKPPSGLTGAAAPPPTNRLQQIEQALAAESFARHRAEQALADTQSVVRDLQTKIGHANLAKTEAVEALQREREIVATLRADLESMTSRLRDEEARADSAVVALQDYKTAVAQREAISKRVERPIVSDEATDTQPRKLIRMKQREPKRAEHAAVPVWPIAVAEPAAVTVPEKRGRVAAVANPAATQDPVKWWLDEPKPLAKRYKAS